MKDEALSRLAEFTNVAQFVSFDPHLFQRHSCIRGTDIDHRFSSGPKAIDELLRRSASGTVNVRTFKEGVSKSLPFHYGLSDPNEIWATVSDEASSGRYCIVNETIDIHDGGVSGVCHGEIVEFAPDDTPRCVEKSGTATLPIQMARRFFDLIYGVKLEELGAGRDERIEFSIHPLRQGFRNQQLIVWEIEKTEKTSMKADIVWPNRFSQKIGDKAFGLLIAHLMDLPVPKTIVISRDIAPFSFGRETGTSESWIRTCPRDQTPGKFTTSRGWLDPFLLLQEEDPDGEKIASVLAQRSVDSKFAGATLPAVPRGNTVEGVSGFGDEFMLGKEAPVPLPERVIRDVKEIADSAEQGLGVSVRLEWSHDGSQPWIVQLHRASRFTNNETTIVKGKASNWIEFRASDGVEALQKLVEGLPKGTGINLIGEVGITSHLGDILRKKHIPSKRISIEHGSQGELFLSL
jgi:hypothetical protein